MNRLEISVYYISATKTEVSYSYHFRILAFDKKATSLRYHMSFHIELVTAYIRYFTTADHEEVWTWKSHERVGIVTRWT